MRCCFFKIHRHGYSLWWHYFGPHGVRHGLSLILSLMLVAFPLCLWLHCDMMATLTQHRIYTQIRKKKKSFHLIQLSLLFGKKKKILDSPNDHISLKNDTWLPLRSKWLGKILIEFSSLCSEQNRIKKCFSWPNQWVKYNVCQNQNVLLLSFLTPLPCQIQITSLFSEPRIFVLSFWQFLVQVVYLEIARLNRNSPCQKSALLDLTLIW